MANKANQRTPRGKRSYDQEFYETMPGAGYADTYDFYGTGVSEADAMDDDSDITSVSPEEIRRRMVRQGVIMAALLVSQIILFALLVRYTINLG